MYEQKAAFFDGQVAAPWAADDYGPDEWSKLRDLFAGMPDLKGCRVLEPGCGTGRLTEILADRVGEQGRVVALDVSSAMVDAAKKRIQGRLNATVHLGAVESFPFDGELFDCVFCHQVFPHIDEKQTALARFAAMLASGGRVIVSHFIGFDEINDVHRKAGSAVADDLMPDEADMRKLFQEAGLNVTSIEDRESRYFLSAIKK